MKYKQQTIKMSIATVITALVLTGCSVLFGTTSPSNQPAVVSSTPGTVSISKTPNPVNGEQLVTNSPIPTPTNLKTSKPLPLSIPPRKAELHWMPMNKSSALREFTLPEGTQSTFPELYAWQYNSDMPDLNVLITEAENAAGRIWAGKTITKKAANNTMTFIIDPKDTEYGPFQESIYVWRGTDSLSNSSRLNYQAMWALYERTPFHYGVQITKTREELVKMAKEFAVSFLGTDNYMLDAPTVYDYPARDLTEGEKIAQTARVTWRVTCDGLPVGNDALTINIINGKVFDLTLIRHVLKGNLSAQTQVLLDAKESLYCLNYTRVNITSKDSIFYNCKRLISVTPVLISAFSDGNAYVPAWEFVIAHDGDAPFTSQVYVNATTGTVYNGSNAGGLYPSAFTLN